MQQLGVGRSRLWLLATMCVFGVWSTCAHALTATPTVAPAVTPTCAPCSRLGSLSVFRPTVDPPMPAVGDVVTFTFPVTYALPGEFECSGTFGSCSFETDAPLLGGDDLPSHDGNMVVVQRRVIGAGVVTVQLRVTAETENQCYTPWPTPTPGCQVYFNRTPIEASSPLFQLQLAGAATPTASPTATPTGTPRSRSDGGCELAPQQSQRSAITATALLVALLLARWRMLGS